MPKLERDKRVARQLRQKSLEPRQIAAQERGQLKQHRAQLAGLMQKRERRKKGRRPLLGILQPLDVRDVLVRLYGEFEVLGRGSDPARQQFLRGEAAKCVVQLDGIEAGAVVSQEFGRGKFRRIKLRLPLRVGPAGRACIQLTHGFPGSIAMSRASRSGFAGASGNYLPDYLADYLPAVSS